MAPHTPQRWLAAAWAAAGRRHPRPHTPQRWLASAWAAAGPD